MHHRESVHHPFFLIINILQISVSRKCSGVQLKRRNLADPTLLMCSLISETREPPSSVNYVLADSRSYFPHGVKTYRRPLQSVFHLLGFVKTALVFKMRPLVDHVIVTFIIQYHKIHI